MRLKIILISSMLCLAVGCSDTNNQSEQENTSQTKNTGYESSHGESQDHINENDPNLNQNDSSNKDVYTNDTTVKIKELLTERQDIRRAQVASTEDRVMIAVNLSHNADRDKILDSIEDDVEDIVSDKELVIYTGDAYWNRMKNLGSKLKNLTDDDDIDEYIDKHFFQE